MGIPSYFSFIVKNHIEIIKRLYHLKGVHNFYLDSNSIIYDCLRALQEEYKEGEDGPFEEKLIAAVCSKIDIYLCTVRPTSTLFIAFDGVAPVAKLEQQRNRRYKSHLVENLRGLVSNSSTKIWDKTAITPGTAFMKKLGNYITEYYAGKEEEYGLKKIIISSPSEPGEGEHKLFAYIRDNPKKHSEETNLVYGLDADLIMLCLNHLPISRRIYLYRETPEFIKSIDASLEPEEAYYLDIPELARTIICQMTGSSRKRIEVKDTRLYDYIFLCFFMGNDFMPHFPALNIRTGAIHTVLSAYQNTIGMTNKCLTDGKRIYWSNVKKLVKYLADGEPRNIREQYRIRDRWEKRRYRNTTVKEKMDRLEAIPTKERQLERFIDPASDKWEGRYYKALFDTESSRPWIRKISINYLEGLEWVMKYYTSGCPDWNWCYRYRYPPLLKDLLLYIPNWETRMIAPNRHLPVHPLVQLAYVLPGPSLKLLPASLEAALRTGLPGHYGLDFKIYWAFCKYLWEGHVALPHMDIEGLKQLVKNHIKYK